MDTTPSQPAPAPAPEKKPLFETVVTSTPVLLAVIATFILGQSSSEMTKAQYQRSLAGQNQSKVGDQWALFQAKRIRGTTYETAADLLSVRSVDPFTGDALEEAADSILREIQLAAKLDLKAKGSEQLKALEAKAEKALAQIKTALHPPAEGWKGKRTKLDPENVKAALDALQSYALSKPDKSGDSEGDVDTEQRNLLEAVLKDIRAFKPEKEIAPKTISIKEETVDMALEKAKANAARVNKRGKDIDNVLEEFDALVNGQVVLARELQRILGGQVTALMKSNGEPAALEKLESRLERVRGLATKLQGDYKAARHGFTARRYEDEARSFQDEAYLYDVKVLLSSARSDRHLKRSFGFMIAMLIAQAGVTVGSLALAFKRRVPVWLIAVIAGAVALAFGAYVFLELGPLVFG